MGVLLEKSHMGSWILPWFWFLVAKNVPGEAPDARGDIFCVGHFVLSWSVWLLLGLNIYKPSDKALKSRSRFGAG